MHRFEILQPGEFHIFRIVSDGDENILSDSEKKRYAGFLSSTASQNYLKGHSAARVIAANYTGKKPSHFDFATTPEGKPFFKCTPHLNFNLSHSGDSVFIAFSFEQVGFDIENISRKTNFHRLAKRFFHPEELELISHSKKPEATTFLELWTAKEAMLKLFGLGIASGLDKALLMSEEDGFLNNTKIHLFRYIHEDFLGTLASFLKPRVVREFTY